jgi:hypothetical protein
MRVGWNCGLERFRETLPKEEGVSAVEVSRDPPDDRAQVSFIERDQTVQAFAPDGPPQATPL